MMFPSKTSVGLSTTACRLIAIATVICMGATRPDRTAAQAPSGLYTVSGVVEDGITHQPIARVLVESGSEAALTDSEGRFEFHLPAGPNQINIRRPGYSGGPNGRTGSVHLIPVGPKTPPLVFYLKPSAFISGRVSVSSADEGQTFQINLYQKHIVDGYPSWEQSTHTRSWSDGSFRLPELDAPGLYVLCVELSANQFNTFVPGSPVYGYAGACYPGGMDAAAAAASPLKLEPGKDAQVEISLARQQFFPVSVSVVGGGQNVGVELRTSGGMPLGVGMIRNKDSGAFETFLPNGSYSFESHIWGDKPQDGRVDFTVAGAPVSGLSMVLRPVSPVKINLHREVTATPQLPQSGFSGSAPLSLTGGGAGYRDTTGRPNISISLIPANRFLNGAVGVNFKPVDGDWAGDDYELVGPPQGSFWLKVSGFDSYVSSMTMGATDLFREPLHLGAGSRAEPIDITLRNDMGHIECRTAGESGTPNDPATQVSPLLFLYAIPQLSNQERIYQWVSQGFSLRPTPSGQPLPPGRYLVVAFKQAHEIDLDDQNEMARLSSRGQIVTISPGTTTQVVVDPIPDADEEASQ